MRSVACTCSHTLVLEDRALEHESSENVPGVQACLCKQPGRKAQNSRFGQDDKPNGAGRNSSERDELVVGESLLMRAARRRRRRAIGCGVGGTNAQSAVKLKGGIEASRREREEAWRARERRLA